MSHSEKIQLHRADIILIVLLATLGIMLTGFIYLPSKESGKQLEIRRNGEVVMKLSLSQNIEKTVTDTNGNVNTFYIKDGAVTMSSSNCGDKTCVHTGSIDKAGQSIVCLPHRLVLFITAEDDSTDSAVPDAIVK